MIEPKISIGVVPAFVPPMENVVRAAKRNEAEGYSVLWWPDHLMSFVSQSVWTPDVGEIAKLQPNPHVYLEPIATIAAVATQTHTVKLGTGVTEALRRHPAMLAQAFLTLDHVTKGRVIFGLGAGEAMNTIPYGVDFRYTASKVEEALQVIRLLWSTDQPVDFHGRFFQLKNAVLGLRPYGPEPPPIWLAAAGPHMLDICARYADGWLPSLMPIQQYSEKLDHILELARGYGRDMCDFQAGLFANIIVDEDHKECHRLLEHPLIKSFLMLAPTEMLARHGAEYPLGPDHKRPLDYVPTHFSRNEILDAISRLPAAAVHDYFIHGTPDEVCAQLEDYAAVGLRHAALCNMSQVGDISKLRSSYECMLKIVEHFR